MNKNILTFKKINPVEHGQLLYEMDIDTFTRDFDYPSPSVAMTLDYFKNCQTFLVYKANVLVGVFAFSEKNNAVEAKQIIVLPEYQNQGFGSQIVKKIIDLNKNKNIWLVTHPQNTSAIILYLKSGFKITAWKNNYFGDGQPRLVLKR